MYIMTCRAGPAFICLHCVWIPNFKSPDVDKKPAKGLSLYVCICISHCLDCLTCLASLMTSQHNHIHPFHHVQASSSSKRAYSIKKCGGGEDIFYPHTKIYVFTPYNYLYNTSRPSYNCCRFEINVLVTTPIQQKGGYYPYNYIGWFNSQ